MGQDYVTIFINSALFQGNALAPLSLLLLFMCRILPVIGLVPFFGAKVLPHPVKVILAISFFVIFLPKLLDVTKTSLTFNPMLVLYATKELFIGFILGYMMGVPFTIVQTAGIIIDHQRGGASLMINDPTIQNQSSPLGTLFNYVMIVLFFYIDGPFLFIEAIMGSYDIIPPDKFFNTDFFFKGSEFWSTQIKLFNDIMVIAIQMATPALLIILMTNVFLGIANRLAPQVQITFLGMPLISLLALGIVFFGWKLICDFMTKQLYTWLAITKNMISLFNPP